MTMQTMIATLLLGVLAVRPPFAAAAPNPAKAAIKCRKALAKQGMALVVGAMKRLDACHARRDRTGSGPDCNAVDLSPQRARLASARARACAGANDVLANYANGDPATAITQAAGEALAASGRELQGSPALGGDEAKRRCHGAIGKARSGIVTGVLKGATACQKGHDQRASRTQSFGELATDCAARGAGAAGGRATRSVGKACSRTPGADVGSCDPLPACVVQLATATGQEVAQALYSSPGVRVPECRDGVVDPGEECDPGGDTDECFECHPERCGNGRVVVTEQCDDGDTVPGDGCDATCRVEGRVVTVVVSLTHAPALVGDVYGVELTVDYLPAKASLPGSGNVGTTEGRVANLGPPDVQFSVADRDASGDGTDDQLFIPYGGLVALPPGDLVRVIFDGAPQAAISAADFTCQVQTAVDAQATPVGGVTCAVSVTVAAPRTTTTTVTSTTTTTSVP
jgi:cysteine-rich repeat protein